MQKVNLRGFSTQVGPTQARHLGIVNLKATLSIFYGQQIPTGLFLPCRKEKNKISLLADVGENGSNLTDLNSFIYRPY